MRLLDFDPDVMPGATAMRDPDNHWQAGHARRQVRHLVGRLGFAIETRAHDTASLALALAFASMRSNSASASLNAARAFLIEALRMTSCARRRPIFRWPSSQLKRSSWSRALPRLLASSISVCS